MFNNDRNKLFLYVTISLIFHLLLFYFFPFGYLQGFSNEEASGENFGYVQYVEYKTQSNQKTEEETRPEPEQEVEKEPEEEPEEEPEIQEEAEPEEEPEPEEVENNTDQEDIEIAQEEEVQEEVEETENNQEQEVITSEESDTEVEVQQEEEEPAEEEQNQKPEEEVEPTPPPPPTAGELIGLSPKPVYPKYLVSEAKSGKVGLSVQVDPEGEVENIIVTNSSDIESMDRNARLTIENGWEFRSYKQRYKIDVTVTFNIDNNGNPNVDIEIGKVNFL